MSNQKKPVVLCILDGWGERADGADNAVYKATTPNWDRLATTLPHARLDASAGEVGLPEGQMGNSEVGHMNIGAGRVVMQDLPRIDAAVADGSLADVNALKELINTLQQTGGTCHLLGLLSPGGVHSHQDHMVALAKILDDAGVPVALHGFLDGRDTPPKSAKGFIEDLQGKTRGLDGFSIATISGRYYAMDRDKRWDRVEKAWKAMVRADGERADDALGAVDAGYANEVTDEFLLPTVIGDFAGMKDGDGLLMANYRADRAREILSALADDRFDGFDRGQTVSFAAVAGLSEYSTDHNRFVSTLFPPLALSNILGEVVADKGLKQLRIAETEKYAHVTFFFNGGREEVYPGEERILIASPDVATYDLKPEMSAVEVTDKLVEAIESGRFDLIVVNYANGDMVGHTGILEAAIRAAGAVDECLGRLATAVEKAGGVMLVTADHGNCEMMLDPVTGEPHTAHTLNKVPLILVNAPDGVTGLKDGRLADIAPTLLALLNIDQPADMTGVSLLEGEHAATQAAE